jgi:phosphate transport system substrate-binding protein
LKKQIVIPAATIAAALALAACGSGGGSSTNSGSPAGSAGSSSTSGASNTVTGNPSSSVTLTESGSSLMYPYLQAIAGPLHQAYSNITLKPAPGGSGKGISDAIAGNTTLGGSDAYLSNAQLSQNQDIMNVPVVVSAQAINYNLKGVKSLKLSGDVLAKIYEGKITKWNDPAIAALNSGTSLPSQKIVPVRRVDASGDTFIFTSLLSQTNQDWSNGPSFNTSVNWPSVSGELTAQGNPGMVQTCGSTPGCIAYVGVSSQKDAQAAGLGTALLQNKAGNFVAPDQSTISAAVSAGATSIPANLALPLIFEPGAQSYPIVNFEYLVVKRNQGSADQALAVRTLLTWAMSATGGSQPQYLNAVSFVALPDSVRPQVQQAISQIKG